MAHRRLVAAHACAARFFAARVAGSWVPGYLAGRGLAASLGPPWCAGYAPPGWTALVRHLRTLGFTDAEILTAGLGTRSRTGTVIDRFRDRVTFPVRDADGATVAFIARAAPGGRAVPKYLNSPRTPVYTKSAVLYGLGTAGPRLAAGATPVLVEGVLDAVAVHVADPEARYAPVTPSGTALTPAQATALTTAPGRWPAASRPRDRRIIVAFDGDPAGRRAAARAYTLLRDATPPENAPPHRPTARATPPQYVSPPGGVDRGAVLEWVRLAEGSDPAGVLAECGAGGLRAALGDRVPLAGLVLDEGLEVSRGRAVWARRDAAARVIAELAGPEVMWRLARAVAGALGTGAPENAAPLPPYAVAALLPALPRHLVARAADGIGVTASEILLALAEAAEPATGAGGRASRR